MPIKLMMPVKRVRITQGFGENPHMYAMYGMKGHNGIDFGTRFPDTPLGHVYTFPMAPGKVIETGDQDKHQPNGMRVGIGYGKFVRLQHADGSQTTYGHLWKIYVKVGQMVSLQTILALTDNTGFSTGPHLHVGYRPPNFMALYNNGYKGSIDFKSFLIPRV